MGLHKTSAGVLFFLRSETATRARVPRKPFRDSDIVEIVDVCDQQEAEQRITSDASSVSNIAPNSLASYSLRNDVASIDRTSGDQ